MIRESDIQWWILEAQKHPESAPEIIEELAKRLLELDAENEQLRQTLLRLQQRAPTSQSSPALQTLKQQVETLQKALQRQDGDAPALVLLADRLQAGAVPLSRALQWADQSRPMLGMRAALSLQTITSARPGDELLLVTNRARACRRMAASVDDLGEQGRWPVPAKDLELDDGERLTAVAVSDGSPRLWTIVTRRGFVQRLVRAGMDRQMAQEQSLLQHLGRGDAPVALVPGSQGDLILLTRWGLAIRFGQHTIETQGSWALDLDPDDQVVGALALAVDSSSSAAHELLIVTASGLGIRRDVAQLPPRSRPGGTPGKPLIQARDVLGLFPYSAPNARIVFATYGGQLAFARAEDAARHARLAQGSRLCDLGHDPAVAVTQIP
jgi:DNA gyrase/topoisomerase IV subunit A